MTIAGEYLRDTIRRRWEQKVQQAVNRTVNETRRAAPQRTGALRTSIYAERQANQGDLIRFVIRADAFYASFVDAGTPGGQLILPVRARALSWIGGGGRRVFAASVIRGATPRTDFWGSANEPNQVMRERWQDALQEVQ